MFSPQISSAVLSLALIATLAAGVSSSQYSLSSPPVLQWETCGLIHNRTVQCSRIDVPVDQFGDALPDETFSIPLIRMLATDPTNKKDIILNPGGPGGSGLSLFWRKGEILSKVIGDDFNLLSFDPRGVNGSHPKASCYSTDAQRAREIASNPWNVIFEAGNMFTRAENKAKACNDTMGDFGAYLNTPQTAADMNTILDAIGQEQLYYWGFSYGTILGQTYAQLFPERISRLVIDGVANLDQWYNSDNYYDSLKDTDRIWSGFLEECFNAKARCPINSIKSAPFETAAELESFVNNYLEEIEENPIPVYINNSLYGSVTKLDTVLNGIFPALYSPSVWPQLAKNLAELFNGNATATFLAYRNSWVSTIIGDETNIFITWNDNWKTGPAAPFHGIKPIQNFTLSQIDSELVSKYQGSDFFDRASWSTLKTHNFHPRYHPEYPRTKTAFPLLVVSTEYDPVCPLRSARKAHNSFEGAGFVEQKSYGHCSISMPSLCTAKHIRRYFTEGVLPEHNTTCDIDVAYFPNPNAADKSKLEYLEPEDVELLTALEDLASSDIRDDLWFQKRF